MAVDDPSTGVQFRTTASGLSGFLYTDGQLFHQAIEGSTITFTPGMPVDETPGAQLTPEAYVSLLEPTKELSHEDLLASFCCIGGPASLSFKFFDLAVVTDDELYQRYPSLIAIQALVEDLVAALNVAYFGDTGVLFRLRWLGMYGPYLDQGMPDPFNGRSDDGVVRELHDIWAPAWTHVPRDLVVLFSGKFLGGNKIFMPWKCVGGPRNGQWCDLFQPRDYAACGSGSCQWVGPSICDNDRSMAVIGIGNSRDSNINKLAHEVGHLFGAEHAHCTQNPATGQYVDRCQSGGTNLRGQACYSGPEYGPASRQSSIMSYCGPPTYPYTFRFDPFNADAINAAAATASCARSGTVTDLTNGTPVTGLNSTPNGPGYNFFSIEVPTGANRLEITTSGGSGELALFARHGTLPTTWGTRKSDRPGTTAQNILVTNPVPGTWYILFFSQNPFSNVTLNAEYQ